MKILPVLQRIWSQMRRPNWCISIVGCATTGGVFNTYAVTQGIDRFIPIGMYIPRYPLRPRQLIRGIIDSQGKILREGTLNGSEFDSIARPEQKPALNETAYSGSITKLLNRLANLRMPARPANPLDGG